MPLKFVLGLAASVLLLLYKQGDPAAGLPSAVRYDIVKADTGAADSVGGMSHPVPPQ